MLIKHCRWSGFVVKVQFHAKCTVLVLTCAVLAERLCSYNLQQCDTTPRTPLGELTALPQTSWVDFVAVAAILGGPGGQRTPHFPEWGSRIRL